MWIRKIANLAGIFDCTPDVFDHCASILPSLGASA